jgi:hypothetical protein
MMGGFGDAVLCANAGLDRRQGYVDVLAANALFQTPSAVWEQQVAAPLDLDAALAGPAETSPVRGHCHSC